MKNLSSRAGTPCTEHEAVGAAVWVATDNLSIPPSTVIPETAVARQESTRFQNLKDSMFTRV